MNLNEQSEQALQIARLQADNASLRKALDSHIFVSHDEFAELVAFMMQHDDPQCEQIANMDTIHSVLNQIAVNCLGYSDWTQAYHEC